MSVSKVKLRNKINELFNHRFLPGILNEVEKDSALREQFIEDLIVIQEAIYHLDHVLESEWDIIDSHLDGKWEVIYDSLRAVGIGDDSLEEYCRHIFKYQKHELEQRKGKSLLRLSMEYFYFYKSCDVKLLRRLIYDRYPSLNSRMPLADWRWFDLVTEVNDDVLDVYEDLDTNNGNRFLLSIEKFGIDDAHNIYLTFLEEIRNTFDQKVLGKKVHPVVIELTDRELTNTMELLNRRQLEIKANPIITGAMDSI